MPDDTPTEPTTPAPRYLEPVGPAGTGDVLGGYLPALDAIDAAREAALDANGELLDDDGPRRDGTTLSHRDLVDALRAQAEGLYGAEAAVEVLIAHGSWLRRGEFLAHVTVAPAFSGPGHMAAIDWPGLLVAPLGCSGSERRVLDIAAELAGVDSGETLAESVSGLDSTNIAIVLRGILHASRGSNAGPVEITGFTRYES